LLKFVMIPLQALPLPRGHLQRPLTVLTRQKRQAVHVINQSIFVDVYALLHKVQI